MPKFPILESGQHDLKWLLDYVIEFDNISEENSGFDWDHAEELVSYAVQLPDDFFTHNKQLKYLLNNFKSQEEWDCGDVTEFSSLLITELKKTLQV